MKRLCIIVLATISFSAAAFDRLALSSSAGNNEQQLAVDATRFWRISSSKFWFGLGIRGTSQWNSDQGYKTAPALLTTGQEGPQVIFLSDKKDNIDDLRLQTSQVTSINAMVQFLYQWSDTWGFGTNIDVMGGSFGKKQKARYSPKKDDGSYPDEVSARPTPFNLLLVSENDRGSLNSEFYAVRNLGSGWGLKLAANFSFTEYTTKTKLRKNNDRFRRKTLLPSIGLTRDF
jgi:hypothetical protein